MIIILCLTLTLILVLMPSLAFAWGPLTHAYLGSSIYSFASLIPAGIIALLKAYRKDFIYGNLIADMILGRKYLPYSKDSHSWDVGLRLLDQAEKEPEKAFVYGYLSHLAADTVAHEILTKDKRDLGHAWLEIKADSIIDKVFWLESVNISRAVQRRNDRFLEGSIEKFIFSFKTNKRIFEGIVLLSVFNKKRKSGIDREYISILHNESMTRMLDLLKNGKNAAVLSKNPL